MLVLDVADLSLVSTTPNGQDARVLQGPSGDLR